MDPRFFNKHINYSNNKLLKLKILKNEVFDKECAINYIHPIDIEKRLKKIFTIIHIVHISNRKIVFLDNFLHENKSNHYLPLFKKTKHYFVNPTLINVKTRFKLEVMPSLIVTFDQNQLFQLQKILKNLPIPIISLNSYLNMFDTTSTYKVVWQEIV